MVEKKDLIDGVKVKELKRIDDERGFLFEILRSDWPEFQQFGQVYVTCCNPGYAKAWHFHKLQTDYLVAVKGKAKIVLYDARKESSTFGKVNEFVVSVEKPMLIVVPPMVYHGFTALGNETTYVCNTPNQLYNYENPDEHRVPFNDENVPYDWGVEKGG